MRTRVSVIIPCFRQAHFLGDAVQSVLDQDYPYSEVIVVNDGSPDNTREVASSFGSRIVYIEQRNGGAAAARNAGISAASGDYIAFLDADDICMPGRLSLEAAVLDQDRDIGLVATDAWLIDGAGKRLGLKSEVSGTPQEPRDFRWETVSYCATTSTVMVRRICFDSAGYFEESDYVRSAGEDWLAWVRMSHDFGMRYLTDAAIAYRIHDTNLTRFVDKINEGNRRASHLAVTWDRFSSYPAHFRSKLLFYRFAAAWHVEPKAVALKYFLRAVKTDPTQFPYGVRVARQGIANTLRRRRW